MAKVSLITSVTNTTLFSGENFTSTVGATSASLNISRFDNVLFYAIQNNTGAALLASTLTAEVSPDGTTFFGFDGFLTDSNLSNTGTTQYTFNTGTTEVFSMKNLGGINTIRFTLTMANQIASTSFTLRYSARTTDV